MSLRTRSSQEWYEYYRSNEAALAEIPWEEGPWLSGPEREAVAASIQEFQLGESSEGKNLYRAAGRYAGESGDEEYVRAIKYFIREEQRHARYLRRFLALEGIEPIRTSRVDAVFRRLRLGSDLEVSVGVLITAEIIAKVYYAALKEATRSPVPRSLCDRILRDEAEHARFQAEQLAIP